MLPAAWQQWQLKRQRNILANSKTAIDPQTGEFNANLLPEHIKEEIKSKSGVIASLTGVVVGGTPIDVQI